MQNQTAGRSDAEAGTFAPNLDYILVEPPAPEETDSAAFLRQVPKIMASIAVVYDTWVAENGPTAPGVGWSTEERQMASFETLWQVVSPELENVSINDLGCGYGAMFDAIKDKPQMRRGEYIGYDVSARMVTMARQVHRDARAHFVQRMMALSPADYTVASGIFNLKVWLDGDIWRQVATAHWNAYVRTCLKSMILVSRRGIAFNLLSHKAPERDPLLYYADPEPFLKFVRDRLASKVELLDGYMPDEWTILAWGPWR